MLTEISKRLSEMKAESGLSTRKLAELSGVPEGTVSKILSGQTEKPSFEAVNALCAAMGYSLSDIFSEMPKEKVIGVTDHYQHIINAYKEQIEVCKDQISSYRKEIKILYFSLIAIIIVIMLIILVDIMNGGVGYIRY